MKLGTLINNQDILERLYKTKVDGKKALRLRKSIKKLNEELSTFNEARDEYIKENGETSEDGSVGIKQNTEVFNNFIKYLNEMLDADIDGVEPILTEEDLETLDLSVEDIDRIEMLGLLKE